jgi:hypothetical protein
VKTALLLIVITSISPNKECAFSFQTSFFGLCKINIGVNVALR